MDVGSTGAGPSEASTSKTRWRIVAFMALGATAVALALLLWQMAEIDDLQAELDTSRSDTEQALDDLDAANSEVDEAQEQSEDLEAAEADVERLEAGLADIKAQMPYMEVCAVEHSQMVLAAVEGRLPDPTDFRS